MELKANELRIGHLVEINMPITNKIISIDVYHISGLKKNKGYFKPIPLTEEWLFKFGFFTIKAGKLIDATLPNFRFSLHKSGNYDGFLFCEKNNIIINIDYVHQLQNLYFALTNKELEIKM